MKPTDITKFKRAIIKAIDKHLTDGGKLVAGDFGGGNTVCPITCLWEDLGSLKGSFDQTFAKKLGIPLTNKDMWDFITGFDFGTPRKGMPMYNLGTQIRAKYLPFKE
jgi:hypothetical protein